MSENESIDDDSGHIVFSVWVPLSRKITGHFKSKLAGPKAAFLGRKRKNIIFADHQLCNLRRSTVNPVCPIGQPV